MKVKIRHKVLASVICLVLLAIGLGAYLYNRVVEMPNYNIGGKQSLRLYIYPGDDWDRVQASLDTIGAARHPGDMRLLLTLRKGSEPRPGSYLISSDMTTLALFRALAGGRETPINLRFNSVRLPKDLYKVIGDQLMVGEEGISSAMRDTMLLRTLGIGDSTFAFHAIPNTYEVYWSTTAEKLVERLANEYRVFWDEERKTKADRIGLSPYEVAILASIVQEESSKTDEHDDIAGLYLNRLRIGMPLQADPTVKYAVGDFSLQRILYGHLSVESPYNTYLNRGLPPTPICIPSTQAIDGVLNASEHNYIYMCAREDFSGYHNFAATLAEHKLNAQRYRVALNKLGIK